MAEFVEKLVAAKYLWILNVFKLKHFQIQANKMVFLVPSFLNQHFISSLRDAALKVFLGINLHYLLPV